ncbi:hypothetical protein RHGRI_028840 [Rhododendron griersonianum]|uniref:NADH dehydrogenase subunit 4 n=1 Tax=Rhododendron griersonianum TaxID=479676 RepID=A0AAV6IHD0_9ERIC|nr:hypothetical protein RHGRI_028840 [Rhododendron griersonianum]
MVSTFFFLGSLLTTGSSSSFSQRQRGRHGLLASNHVNCWGMILLGLFWFWFVLSLCFSPTGVFLTHRSGVSLFFGVGVSEVGYVRCSSWCVVLH